MPVFSPVHTEQSSLLALFLETRAYTEALCHPLSAEDHGVQSAEIVSPTKWHLAHTSWFFEEFLLKEYLPFYRSFHPQFRFLFNSYYQSKGAHIERGKRSFLSRPSLKEIQDYRKRVSEAIIKLWKMDIIKEQEDFLNILELGIQHEKQHQELILTDIKYNFYQNPLYPAYQEGIETENGYEKEAQEKDLSREVEGENSSFLELSGGLYCIGSSASEGFCYDNEMPEHKVYLNDFRIARKLVKCKEYLEFIESGGYSDFRHWLSEGWDWVQKEKALAPLYWQKRDGLWRVFTLGGFKSLELEAPVCHLNYYEAMAYASWAGERLPTEMEWEAAALALKGDPSLEFMNVRWQWTSSPYIGYPGFEAFKGSLKEYNSKFMCQQMVLRGGSCVTPPRHIRTSYRNYLYPSQSWQFSGLRLGGNI